MILVLWAGAGTCTFSCYSRLSLPLQTDSSPPQLRLMNHHQVLGRRRQPRLGEGDLPSKPGRARGGGERAAKPGGGGGQGEDEKAGTR